MHGSFLMLNIIINTTENKRIVIVSNKGQTIIITITNTLYAFTKLIHPYPHTYPHTHTYTHTRAIASGQI